MNERKSWHQRLNFDMGLVLGPLARDCGLEPFHDTGVIAGIDNNFRIPDQVYAWPAQVIGDGVSTAALVVEVRSRVTRATRSCRSTPSGVFVRCSSSIRTGGSPCTASSTGEYQPVDDGRSEALGVTFSTVDGPKVRTEWDGGSAQV